MSTTRTRRRVTSLVGAIVMLLPVSLAMAEGQRRPEQARRSHLHEVGLTDVSVYGRLTGATTSRSFVGEVLQRQVSVNPDLNGNVNRLEAIYEVQQTGTVRSPRSSGAGQTA